VAANYQLSRIITASYSKMRIGGKYQKIGEKYFKIGEKYEKG